MSNKLSLIIIVIFLIIHFQISCNDKGVTGDPSTSISGYVLDSITRLPIDSAKICIDDTIECAVYGYSDSVGYYKYNVWG